MEYTFHWRPVFRQLPELLEAGLVTLEVAVFSMLIGIAIGLCLALIRMSGKRPLSSMTPTLVFKDGKPWLVTGSPGGSRIITTVLQIILNTVDHGMNVAAATAAPRMHHQWLPDELRIEPGFSRDSLRLLVEKGHRVVVKNAMGSTQSLLRIEEGWTGASDPRRPGALTLGY